MAEISFSTGNETKLLNAQAVCRHYGITVTQKIYEVDEIQGENPEKVALKKAEATFLKSKGPVVVTDDSWMFLGLKGFPGIYMHSMNKWLTPEDFLRLTKPLQDRRVTLTQYLVFIGDSGPKIFKHDTHGTLIKEIRGDSPHPSHTIISMDGDNGLTIAEAYNQGKDRSKLPSAQIWHDFAKWYVKV